MAPRFTRTKEDFTCGRCGAAVLGNGYTNHCPRCLWSRHVDINPGDRQEVCGGLMRPMAVEIERGEYTLIHQCGKCGSVKRNKISTGDDFETIINLAKCQKF